MFAIKWICGLLSRYWLKVVKIAKKAGALFYGHWMDIVIGFSLVVTIVFLVGNTNVSEGDMVSNSNLDKTDFFSTSDAKVRDMPGFRAGDQVGLIIPMPEGANQEELNRLLDLHRRVKEFFPNCGVSSLASIDRYTSDGMLGVTHVDGEEINSKTFDLENWEKSIREDISSFGLFVGRNFDFLQIIIFLDADFEETALRNKLTTLMEGVETPWWKWIIWKNDIKPQGVFEDVLLRGWGVARGILTAILKTDILKTSFGAVILMPFFLRLCNGSWIQSLYPSFAILLGIIWVRGAIGIADYLGFELFGEPVKERVYMLLVDACILVNGISFPVRKLDAYNSFRAKFSDLTRRKVWEMTRRFDGKISIVAIISISGFASSLSPNRGVVEFSILSAIAVGFLWFMTKYLLPAMHNFCGGEVQVREETWFSRIVLGAIVNGCYRLLVNKHHKKVFWGLVFFTTAWISTAVTVVVHDIILYEKGETWIELSTTPADYFSGTSIEKAMRFLNQPDRPGFCSLQFFVVGDIYDPDFLKECFEHQREIRAEVEGVREVRSIVDVIVYISRVQFGVDIPDDPEKVRYIYDLIEYSGDPLILESRFCQKGIAMDVLVPGEKSTEMERQAKETIQIVNPKTYRDEFDDSFVFDFNGEYLEILPYGRSHEYHQSDKIIQKHQPKNTMYSYWMIVVMSAVWIYRRRRGVDRSNQIYDLVSLRTGFAMAIPFAFSSSGIVFLMVLCDMPFDQAMACIAPLSITAATDFNLHVVDDFNDALMEGKSYSEALHEVLCVKGKVNVVDILTNAFVFSFLIMSRFGPVKLIGILLVLMMFACGFGALVLMMALLRVCIKPVSKNPSRLSRLVKRKKTLMTGFLGNLTSNKRRRRDVKKSICNLVRYYVFDPWFDWGRRNFYVCQRAYR